MSMGKAAMKVQCAGTGVLARVLCCVWCGNAVLADFSSFFLLFSVRACASQRCALPALVPVQHFAPHGTVDDLAVHGIVVLVVPHAVSVPDIA
eukprot:437916-Rhodomonas_salina.1